GPAWSTCVPGEGWQKGQPAGPDEGVLPCRGEWFLNYHCTALRGVQHAAWPGDDAHVMWSPALVSEEEEVAGAGLGCRDVLACIVLVVGVRSEERRVGKEG